MGKGASAHIKFMCKKIALSESKVVFVRYKKQSIVAFVIATLCIGFFCYCNIGLWLAVTDPLPESLDVIFTFGSEPSRINYSKQLFAKYNTSLWIDSYQNKRIKGTFAQNGLDTSRIIIIDTCKNTYSEILYVKDWVDSVIAGKKPVKASIKPTQYSRVQKLRIGFVSDPYHMRRIKITVGKKIKNPYCQCYFLSVPFGMSGYSKDAYKNWWKRPELKPAIVSELKKIVYYTFWK